MPVGVAVVDLIECESEGESDAAAQTAERHHEVVADVEHAPQSPRQRIEQIVDEDAQEENEDEDGERLVENVGCVDM